MPYMGPAQKVYHNLQRNQIRLLIVEPAGRVSSPIRCSLQPCSLTVTPLPQFETISYCWGTGKERTPISVNGELTNIPVSAERAIRCVRLSDLKRTIWIDAVCIDQGNLDERAQQVALMGTIYKSGQRNIIFFGNDPERKSKRAFSSLQAAQVKLDQAVGQLSADDRHIWEDLHWRPDCFETDPPLTLTDIAPLEIMYEAPWFTRLWVVQEACLARDNLCYWGQTQFPLVWIIELAVLGLSPRTWRDSSFEGFHTAFWLHQNINCQQPFSKAMDFFKIALQMRTREAHDRVYAIKDLLHGAADDGSVDLMVPDYRKPEGAVFRDATIYVLTSSKEDEILSEICHRDHADMLADGKTSWTASWDRPYDPVHDQHSFTWQKARAGIVNRRRKLKFEVESRDQNTTLLIKGFLMDGVSQVTDPFAKLFSESLQDMQTAITAALELTKTLTAGVFSIGNTATAILTGGAMQNYFDDLSKATKDTEDLPEFFRSGEFKHFSSWRDNPIDELKRNISLYSSHRCFFTLGAGLIGSGPKIMPNGDQVAVCLGAALPYILRPTGLEDNSFYLIGTAYIPGLMSGEVFSMGIEEQEIRLR